MVWFLDLAQASVRLIRRGFMNSKFHLLKIQQMPDLSPASLAFLERQVLQDSSVHLVLTKRILPEEMTEIGKKSQCPAWAG